MYLICTRTQRQDAFKNSTGTKCILVFILRELFKQDKIGYCHSFRIGLRVWKKNYLVLKKKNRFSYANVDIVL